MTLGRAELWFCAPDVPAIGEAQLFLLPVETTMRRIWVRLADSKLPSGQAGRRAYELFVQAENERDESCVLRRDGTVFWSDAERADNSVWLLYLRKMLLGHTSRVWCPRRGARFALVVHSTGEGAVFGLEGAPLQLWNTHFSWGRSRDFGEFAWWPQSKFESFFERELADEHSSLRRAYEWHGWNEEQRTSHVTQCEYGSWNEMKSLAECVLKLAFEGVPEESFWDLDVWDILNEDSNDPFRFHTPFELECQWARTFRRVFRPLILREDAPRFELDHLSQQFFHIYPQHLRAAPSAHEKLEAHFRLREWVMEHAPDEAERLLDFSRSA